MPLQEPIPPKVAAAHRYITRHFLKELDFGGLARAVRVSEFHLHRQFRRHYGTTMKRLATELQFGEAKRLMLADVPLGEVHERIGLATQAHFSTRFKQVVGLTPRAWLRQQRNGQQPR